MHACMHVSNTLYIYSTKYYTVTIDVCMHMHARCVGAMLIIKGPMKQDHSLVQHVQQERHCASLIFAVSMQLCLYVHAINHVQLINL